VCRRPEKRIPKTKQRRKVMKTLTPKQIVDLKPCEGYNLKQITKLFGNKKSMTYLEILNTNKIPPWDIVWVFCRSTVLDDDIRNQWLEVIITRAVTNYALHCGVDDVEEWAQNWLNGVDRTTEAAVNAEAAADEAYAAYAARDAAAYAARDAAADAAGYAAHAATDAAYAAVYFADAFIATRAAAHAAYANDADYATYDAALKIERKQQIQDLKDILQGEM
jgi:hypothetical protein